jgi:hypothetical protein
MANIKISQLPSLGTLSGADQFPVVSTGTTYNVTANVAQDYMSTYPGGTFTGAVFSATDRVEAVGNITSGNLRTSGQISATGTVQAGNLLTTGQISATGTVQAGNLLTTGQISATGNIVNTGSLSTAGSISATGNIVNAGSLSTAGSISAAGNITVSGSFSSSNVIITGGSITGITDLAVADGGTGSSSLTANNVLLGNGTSPLQVVAPGTLGNVLASNGSTWASFAPASILPGLGYGGSGWSDLTSSRAFNTQYTNSSNYPIAVSARTTCSGGSAIAFIVNGITISNFSWQFNGCGSFGGGFVIVPPGQTYQLNSGQGLDFWRELR